MFKLRWIAILVLVLIAVQPSLADDRAQVHGVWKLISFEREFKSTGEKEPLLGKNPTGYAIFTSEGRAMFVLTPEGRKGPKTDRDRADLLKSMYAYTGTYRFEADKLIIKPDVSWNPEWIGTEQERFFKIDGDRLQIINMWHMPPNTPDKGMWRGIITWERVK